MYLKIFKPFFDILISIILLVLLSPLFIFLTFILCIFFKGKPFFIQKRTGLHGKIFKLIKFKTMKDINNEQGVLLPDEERITNFGIFLRKTSMDEIPQLINVLRGEMSFVGPRPLLPEYLNLYNDFQKRRHELKPGITGWAQINGRNAISWKKKFELDVWYVDNVSLWLDIKIIFLTFLRVAKREGISSSTYVTMEKFNGNN